MSYRISGSLLHRHRGYCRIEPEDSCSIESEKGVFNLEHKDACVLALQLKQLSSGTKALVRARVTQH